MVKKFQAFIYGLCVFGLVQSFYLADSSAANAQAKAKLPEAVIAVVDINHILQVSEPSMKAEEEVKAILKTKVDDLNKRGDALLAEKEALDKQRAILAPDAYQQKLSQLNVQRQNLQREFQVINGKMNEALVGIRLRLRDIIIHMAAEVSKEKGVNIGIDRAKTVFFDNSMDITEDVLAKFNKANPKVEIKVNESGGEGAAKAAPAKKN
ncbi:MAG: OmpH family outer membrane protein [Sneathiella sp.]|nr:OmpH family outer membrane protein [Sneathiella sp.]